MISPTTFYITTVLAIAEGSEELQVSAAFAGLTERETSEVKLVAGCKSSAKATLSVCFGGDLPVHKDEILTINKQKKPSDRIIQNPVYEDNPATSEAVGYVSGDTMTANITFVLNPIPQAPIKNVSIEGALTDCPKGPGKFVINDVTLPAQAKVTVNMIPADAALAASLVQFCDPMVIDWSYTANGVQTNIGKSSNRLHVTLRRPIKNNKLYLTDLFLATATPGAVNSQAALDNIWSMFSKNNSPADVKAWDNRPLIYYPKGAKFGQCPLDERELLLSTIHAGRCGAFAKLFAAALNANGILVNGGKEVDGVQLNIVVATPIKGMGFLVKNWDFMPPKPPYVLWLTMVPPGAEIFDMVPPPDGKTPTYGDLVGKIGLPGQNSPTPSQKIFGDHALVTPDQTQPNGDKFKDKIYYDPSYGVTYTDADDFEKQALDGYVLINITKGGDKFSHFLVTKSIDAKGNQLKNAKFSR